MRPFRIGLIGAGRMGRTHLRALAGSAQVAVTAIAEMSPAARSAVSAPGVTLHESVTEMLDRAEPDGVLIAAPTDQHGAIIAEVAARGLPILCEKPCGLTAAAARASAQATAAAGVGYGASFANQAADLLEGWPDAPWTPGFREGAAVQAVCEAMETSAASGRWVSVGEVITSTL